MTKISLFWYIVKFQPAVMAIWIQVNRSIWIQQKDVTNVTFTTESKYLLKQFQLSRNGKAILKWNCRPDTAAIVVI